jgi:hypothetical protein
MNTERPDGNRLAQCAQYCAGFLTPATLRSELFDSDHDFLYHLFDCFTSNAVCASLRQKPE